MGPGIVTLSFAAESWDVKIHLVHDTPENSEPYY